MADLSINIKGMKAPNPFFLASAPPATYGEQIKRAFDAGWGGAVTKTIGLDPIVNVTNRFGRLTPRGSRLGAANVMGFENIELISDRPVEVVVARHPDAQRSLPRPRRCCQHHAQR